MTSRTVRLTIAGTLILALPLSACGGGGNGDYCEEIETFRDRYSSLDQAMIEDDPDVVANAIDDLRDVAASAPQEIEDEWETLVRAFDGLEAVVGDAEDFDPEDLDALEEQMSALRDIEQISQRINDYTADECGIELR